MATQGEKTVVSRIEIPPWAIGSGLSGGRRPPWEGQLDLYDAETDEKLEITFDQAARQSYTEAFDTFARDSRVVFATEPLGFEKAWREQTRAHHTGVNAWTDAYLAAFRGRGDSVGLEGVAQRAAGVFTALQRAPRVAGVRADAPIRQEASPRPGAPPVERFTVTARLAEHQP